MGTLTVKAVEAAKLPEGKKEVTLHDGDNLSLRLRATQAGVSKAWQFHFRFADKRDKVHIGSYPAISLADARAKADECHRLLAQHINPKTHFEREKSIQKSEAIAVSRGETPVTVQNLFERWQTDYLSSKHIDGGDYVAATFRRHVFTDLGDLHLKDINALHIKLVLDKAYKDKGLKRTCGVILANLRKMFVWGTTFRWIPQDPTYGLSSNDWDGYGEEGQRTLTDGEIVMLYKQMHAEECTLANRWNYATWLIMATTTRSEETLLAKRDHVDLEESVWMIPVENQKKTRRKTPPRDHFIHLSPFAMDMMKKLLELPGTEEFIFPADIQALEKPRPCNKKTHYHALRNRTIGGEQVKGRARDTSSLQLPGGDYSPQDFRRTSATIMGELEVEPHVIERCLNHTIPEKVPRTYNKSKLFIPMRESWNELGEHLSKLIKKAKEEMEAEARGKLLAAAVAATEGEI